MGPDFQRNLGKPVVIVASRFVALARASDLEHPRQQEVLEAIVGLAERPNVPPETVKRDGMGSSSLPKVIAASIGEPDRGPV